LDALEHALSVYAHPEKWEKLQLNGMGEDFSWPHSARQYAMIYRSLLSQ
jgi:starch synthase